MNMTRRDMIKAGAVTLASAAVGGCASAGKPLDTKTSYIDAHTHVWSTDLERYPLGPWATEADMQPASFTDRQFFKTARPYGVGRAVLIQHAPLHGYDNTYILDLAQQNPGVFSVVAMINERTPNLKARLRDLRDRGARGIRIGPTKHADRTLNVDPPNWLKAPGMEALWTHAAGLGVAICPLVNAQWLPSLDPMCERHPDTVVVIDHFGHIDINDKQQVESLTRLAWHKNVCVKTSALYKFGDGKAPYEDVIPMLKPVIDAFGVDRLMWASDCPYQMNNGNNYRDAIGLIKSPALGLSAAEQLALLRDTAERVFF